MGTRKGKRVARLCVVLLLGGCMSVPWRTMWDLRHFGPADVIALKPSQLRVAVALDRGCRARAATFRVQFKAVHASRWNRYAFQLRPAAADPALAAQVDASDGPPTNWRLKPADVPRFRDAQARLAGMHEAKKKGRFTVAASASQMTCIPKSRQPTHLSVFLRLGSGKPYLVLFRDARLKPVAH